MKLTVASLPTSNVFQSIIALSLLWTTSMTACPSVFIGSFTLTLPSTTLCPSGRRTSGTASPAAPASAAATPISTPAVSSGIRPSTVDARPIIIFLVKRFSSFHPIELLSCFHSIQSIQSKTSQSDFLHKLEPNRSPYIVTVGIGHAVSQRKRIINPCV